MIKNYLTTAIRNFLRQKGYSMINVTGLAIGLVSCMLILLFVIDELSYDRHFKNKDDIYRIVRKFKDPNGEWFGTPIGAYRLYRYLDTDFSVFDKYTRVSYQSNVEFLKNDKRIEVEDISFVDKEFFDVFTPELISGNIEEGFAGPGNIFLSESNAIKIFGHTNAYGEMMTISSYMGELEVRIAGVYKDFPTNTHFHPGGLVSMKTTEQIFNDRLKNNWGEGSMYYYVTLRDDVTIEQVEEEFTNFIIKNFDKEYTGIMGFELQPLIDIHLKSHMRGEFETNGNMNNVIIFSIVALFILLIAAINYMNLATARSAKRSREVGIRKVVGGKRSQIIGQFLGEAILLSFISMWIAVLMAQFLMPWFNQLSGKELEIHVLDNWKVILLLLVTSVFVGIMAGSYPAFYLSRFNPVRVLYSSGGSSSSNSMFRKTLVVVQFFISVALIISTLVVYHQWRYMRYKDIGIKTENVVISGLPNDYFIFKEEILKNPEIISVTASNKRPTHRLSSTLGFEYKNQKPDDMDNIKLVTIDFDFFETLGNKIIAGRSLDETIATDHTEGFILNREAVEAIGWTPEEAIGKWVQTQTLDENMDQWVDRPGYVIGVAENFNFESLHNEVQPVCFFIDKRWINYMSIKVTGNNISETIKFLDEKWKEMGNNGNFEFSFYDDDIETLYNGEQRFMKIFIIFSGLAILIAALGILGLASYTAEQRTKEIGIRKSLGSSVSKIILLISNEFSKLVVFANIIAWPVAYYLMHGWQQNFPFKAGLPIWIFLLASLLSLAIALLTVIYQAIRAANKNPVEALRYE